MREIDSDRQFVIYIVVNKLNGKRYIGVTGKRYLSSRMNEHFSGARHGRHNGVFYKAIRKYGRHAFSYQVVLKCNGRDLALKEERRLIHELSPEYNSTPGGEGWVRPVISEEHKERLRTLHRGNKYHLGIPHTEETKQHLRELGIRGREQSIRNLAGGWKVQQKRVVCLDDGALFESASSAARHYGISKSAVIENCLRKIATAGRRVFRYFGDHDGGAEEAEAVKAARRGTCEKRPIICLNNLRVFQTNKEAVAATGVSKNTIARSCAQQGQRGTVSGIEFCFLDEWCPNPE